MINFTLYLISYNYVIDSMIVMLKSGVNDNLDYENEHDI